MPTPTREAVVAALLTKLQTIGPPPGGNGTFSTVQRGLVLPTSSDFAKLPQPMICLFKPPGDSEEFLRIRGLPAKRVWTYWIIVYVKVAHGTPWDQTFNPLVDAIEDALVPDTEPEDRLTFNGLVDDCRLDGKALIGNGDTNPEGQGSAALPVKFIVP